MKSLHLGSCSTSRIVLVLVLVIVIEESRLKPETREHCARCIFPGVRTSVFSLESSALPTVASRRGGFDYDYEHEHEHEHEHDGINWKHAKGG